MTALPRAARGKSKAQHRIVHIAPARKAAFEALRAIEQGQAHSDDLLRDAAIDALSPLDRNLATALVLGTIRWQIRLDHQLQRLLDRPNGKLDAEVRIALRLGAFQILHMDRIPARAAIDDSVELAKQAGHRFASGMVNAVLRKLEKMPKDRFPEERAAELASAQAHPAWIVERWVDFYGLDAARGLCLHGQMQPALVLRLANVAIESELNEAGIVLAPGELLSAARMVTTGDVTGTAAFREGRVRAQDEGSQLIAEIAAALANRLDIREPRILDACAAPGGKTLIIAERNPQARILACESSTPRFEQLRQRLAGHADQIECRQVDVTTLNEDAAFDLVIADVPCSGTGTLGRNPEIRHRLRPEDLPRQSERQRAILAAALRAVRPGGRVVYSTCSLEPEENEHVVAAILAAAPGLRPVSLQEPIQSLLNESKITRDAAACLQASVIPQGALRLLPGEFHTDGFFVAVIERI
jgi:16S rRNA (cytosine967-C5)-methyltransferase